MLVSLGTSSKTRSLRLRHPRRTGRGGRGGEGESRAKRLRHPRKAGRCDDDDDGDDDDAYDDDDDYEEDDGNFDFELSPGIIKFGLKKAAAATKLKQPPG